MFRAIAVLVLLSASAFAQTPTTANLWVNTSAGSCTRSASLVAFNAVTACGSMQAAQTAALAGDTVIIKNGTYGAAQTISSSQKASAVSYYAQTPCSINTHSTLSATTCSVIFSGGDFTVTIDHVHFIGIGSFSGGFNTGQHLEVDGLSTFTDLVFDTVNFETAFFGTSGALVENSDFGNGNECGGASEDTTRIWETSNSQAPTNVTFKNNKIHDYSKNPSNCDANHADGLQIFTLAGCPSGMTFDGNLFVNNDTSNIETEGICGSWTVQNNYFGQTVNGGNQLDIGRGTCTGVIIQNNTFQGSGTYDNGVTCTGSITLRSNISVDVIGQCSAVGFTGDHNVQPSGSVTCGTSGKVCSPTWLNGVPSSGNGWDFRLATSDTCAKTAGNQVSFPATDFYGTTRVAGSNDAGAFEIVSGQVATPTFLPVDGTYALTQSVTISSTTASATICYTTDGTTPAANGAGTCTHGTTLANGGTVSVASSVTVQALGTLSGGTDSAVGSATYTIGTPVALLTPSSLSFGGVNNSNTSAPQTLTLQNTGTAVMAITSISLTGANTGDFFQSNNCPVGSNLGNGSSCTITVTFTPLAAGARSASVSVVDGASGSPHTSTLSGTGVQASIASKMSAGARISGRVIVK